MSPRMLLAPGAPTHCMPSSIRAFSSRFFRTAGLMPDFLGCAKPVYIITFPAARHNIRSHLPKWQRVFIGEVPVRSFFGCRIGHVDSNSSCPIGMKGARTVRVGLISDTHTPSVGPQPPPEVAAAFQGVDVILHAGDIYIPSCLDWLEEMAPVYAVELGAGGLFEEDSRVVDKKRVLHLEGHTIGLIHDLLVPGMDHEITEHTPLSKHFPPDADLSAALETVFDAVVDIVVFGHTHYSIVEECQGILMVNPGSPSLPKQMRRLGQVAIMELRPDHKSAEILELSTFN